LASVFEFYFPDKDGNVKPPRCLDDPNWKPGDPVIDVNKIPKHVIEDLARALYEDIKEYYSHPENVAKYEEWKKKHDAGIVEEPPSPEEIRAKAEAQRRSKAEAEKAKRFENARFIREARERLGLTQQEVANRAGISLDYYRSFENGNRQLANTKIAIALPICMTLQLDPAVFAAKNKKGT